MSPTFKNRPWFGPRRDITGGTGPMATLRGAIVTYSRVPARYAATAAVLLTALTSAAAYSIGAPVPATAAATAGILAGAHLVLRHPGVVATLLVLAFALMAIPPVATAYAFWASDGGVTMVDLPSASVTLGATYLLTALLAHRTSRGRAWVTTTLAVAAVAFAGPFLAAIYGPLGFGWAWLCAAVALWLRGGGIAWIADQRHRFTAACLQSERAEAMARDRAVACARTAALLDALPAEYTVFHGRGTPRVGRNSHRIDHLVVGPTGLTIVTTHTFKGRIVDDPDHGLVHTTTDPVDVSGLLNDADTLASIVATRTKLGWLPVRQIVVIHNAVLPAKRSRVGLVARDGSTLGVLTVMSPDLLVEHITDPDQRTETRIGEAQVARTVARIDRLCPPHRTHPPRARRSHRASGSISTYRADMVVMDNEGNRRIPTPDTISSMPQPMFPTSDTPLDIADGQQVCLLTDQGVFDGYHVAGEPVLGDDGITRIPVLDETIDLTAHRDTGADSLPLLWMPSDSIQPISH